jgi:hypothetical protein
MTIRFTNTSTGPGLILPERPGSGIVYRIVRGAGAEEGPVPLGGDVTAFGRTYKVEPLIVPPTISEDRG